VVDAPVPQPEPDRAARLRARIRAASQDVSRSSRRSNARPDATDAELMAALAMGDIAALELLYDRYSTLVFSVSLRVLHDSQLAEDVVQEVFLRLWRQPISYDPTRGRFISWLMSVTRNRSLDELRRVTRRMRSEDVEDDEPGHEIPAVGHLDDPQAELIVAEARAAVRAAMTRLPPAQRRVIELAYFGGLTHVEIAERTGDPLGTVKTRVRLGMRKLRESLAEFASWETDRGLR
jgi:RNA polymerase sigma-70 factor (ECF subfamily)